MGELAEKFYLRAAVAYGSLAEKSGGPEKAKGLRMMQCRYLSSAKRYDESAVIYAELVENFPSE